MTIRSTLCAVMLSIATIAAGGKARAQSWQLLPTGVTTDFHDIAIAPPADSARHGVAIAVGKGGAVIRSTDGGWSWHPIVLQDIDSEALTWHVTFATSDVGLITAGIPAHRLYRTTDAGATWTKLPINAVFRQLEAEILTFISPTTALAIGFTSHILRTTDAGSTWNRVVGPLWTSAGRIVFRDSLVGIVTSGDPGSSEIGYEVRTTDGGVTWQSIDIGDEQCKYRGLLFFRDAWFAVGCDEVRKSMDDGATWEHFSMVAEAMRGQNVRDMASSRWEVYIIDDTPGTIYSSYDNALWHSSEPYGATVLTALAATPDMDHVYAVGNNGVVMRTTFDLNVERESTSPASRPIEVEFIGETASLRFVPDARVRVLTLVSVTGSRVLRVRIEPGASTASFDMTPLSSGVYFAQLEAAHARIVFVR